MPVKQLKQLEHDSSDKKISFVFKHMSDHQLISPFDPASGSAVSGKVLNPSHSQHPSLDRSPMPLGLKSKELLGSQSSRTLQVEERTLLDGKIV